jgi:hypothetical protein
MGEGCSERFSFEFLRWVWNFPKITKPKIEARLKDSAGEKTVVRLRSRRGVEDFFVNLEANKVKS